MKIDILSLFPEMFKGPLTQSIVGKAIEKQLLDVEVTDFRDYTTISNVMLMIHLMEVARACCYKLNRSMML